jgi:hypothetical protein
MEGRPPLDTLHDLGYTGDPAIAVFLPFLPDEISTYLMAVCHPEDGIDLLAHYKLPHYLLVQISGLISPCCNLAYRAVTKFMIELLVGGWHQVTKTVSSLCLAVRTNSIKQ